MLPEQIKERARQLLAPYDDDGWVIIENAIEVWAAAMGEAAAQARLEEAYLWQLAEGTGTPERFVKWSKERIAELEAAMKSTKP